MVTTPRNVIQDVVEHGAGAGDSGDTVLERIKQVLVETRTIGDAESEFCLSLIIVGNGMFQEDVLKDLLAHSEWPLVLEVARRKFDPKLADYMIKQVQEQLESAEDNPGYIDLS